MIYNKSTHPIEVKKISIRFWALRDEIEAAIERRIKECDAAGVPLYIDDIKQYYNLNPTTPLSEQSNVLALNPQGTAPTEENTEENKTFNEADKIIDEQNKQGLETSRPNPILQRPYRPMAPDLEKVSYGFTFLSDINMESVFCFTKDKFLQGQSVVIEFLIPKTFTMTAEVTYCHHYAFRSRIISSTKPDYRLHCRFNFSIPGERATLRSFLQSIGPTLDEKITPQKEAEDDSLGT
jgi:hypothetical protein